MSVTIDITDDVARVTLDDGKANACSHTLLDELEPALDRAERECRAVVLAGRPGVFCGGFDLKVMQGDDAAERGRLLKRGGRMVHRLFGFPRPVVAAATGHGIALGAFWLLACDTRIGGRGDFKFGLNETAIGMALPVFGIELAQARIRPDHLTQAAVQAHIYDPEGAVQAGFLDRLVAPEQVVSEAVAVAGRLAELPADAYAANKLAFRRGVLETIAASLD